MKILPSTRDEWCRYAFTTLETLNLGLTSFILCLKSYRWAPYGYINPALHILTYSVLAQGILTVFLFWGPRHRFVASLVTVLFILLLDPCLRGFVEE